MRNPFFALLLVLIVKAAFMIGVIQSEVIGLGPDEAQYWTWSQQLDFGYYSKPPGIAWQIFAGTTLFGDTEFGVRFFALLIGFFLPLAVFFLARASRLKEWTAFWAAVVMAVSPLGLMSSLLATTDGAMVLFWTLACTVVAKALSQGTTPNYYLVAICIILGALFKWPIYLLWAFVVLAMVVFRALRSYHVLSAMPLSLIGLLPSVWWNIFHDFATFKHVFTTIAGGHGKEIGTTPLLQGNFFEFIGAQVALLSPIFFVILLIAFVQLIKNPAKLWPPVVFCGGLTLITLTGYALVSLFQKMQGNWCVFCYPTGIVFLSWYAIERVTWGVKWMKGGAILSVALVVLVLSIPYLQILGVGIPYKLNPFRHNVGWSQLSSVLTEEGYDPEQEFLLSDKYQITSILSFYGPEKKRAYFLNLRGARKNQFSYWPGMAEERVGKTGYFVLAENEPRLSEWVEKERSEYQRMLADYFREVEYLGESPLFMSAHTMGKGVVVFRCVDYNGKEPLNSEKY